MAANPAVLDQARRHLTEHLLANHEREVAALASRIRFAASLEPDNRNLPEARALVRESWGALVRKLAEIP